MPILYGNEAGVVDTKPVRSALALREPIPAPGPGPAGAPKPSLYQRGVGLGRIVGDVARSPGGRAVTRGLGAAAVLPHFNDYKIDDPEVDSSAGGTYNAVKRSDYKGAGMSASKGLLETGMDLGSAVANTLDYIVPGKAPVSSAYNKFLRDQFSDKAAGAMGVPDQFVDNSGDGPAPPEAGAGRGFVNPKNVDPNADVVTLLASRTYRLALLDGQGMRSAAVPVRTRRVPTISHPSLCTSARAAGKRPSCSPARGAM